MVHAHDDHVQRHGDTRTFICLKIVLLPDSPAPGTTRGAAAAAAQPHGTHREGTTQTWPCPRCEKNGSGNFQARSPPAIACGAAHPDRRTQQQQLNLALLRIVVSLGLLRQRSRGLLFLRQRRAAQPHGLFVTEPKPGFTVSARCGFAQQPRLFHGGCIMCAPALCVTCSRADPCGRLILRLRFTAHVQCSFSPLCAATRSRLKASTGQ